MKEFLEAFAITSVFIIVGYFFFGDLANTQQETGMDMSMDSMDMSAESMESMPGMNH